MQVCQLCLKLEGLVVQSGHYQLIDLPSRQIRVLLASKAELHAARSIEKLADVSADAVLDEELPAWVVTLKVADVQDHVVKYDELLTVRYSLIKLSAVHCLHRRLVGCLVFHPHAPSPLKPDHNDDEDH